MKARMTKKVIGLIVSLLICAFFQLGLAAEDASERAVNAAQKYKGITLNVTWEAGLQAQDPLLYSGPLWEKLTGIKVNLIPITPKVMYVAYETEHLKHSGNYDVLNVFPSALPDLATLGAIEPLDTYIDRYDYHDELKDIAPVFRKNWMIWNNKVYGIPDDGDL